MIKLILMMIVFIALELGALVTVYGLCRLLAVIGLKHWILGFWLLGVPCGISLAAVLAARFATRLRSSQGINQ
jgi:hypothetical protein